MIITCDCGLFMYFCEINKFLQSFLTNLCLGFKCSKFATSCVNVSFRVGRGLMLYAAISACFDDVPPGYQVPRGKGMAMTSIQFRLKRLCSGKKFERKTAFSLVISNHL